MESAPAFHPLDYLSVLRRRFWWLVAPVVIAGAVAAALYVYLPRQYASTVTFGVSLPGVTGSLLSDASRVTPEERTRSINQLLLSPAVLERIVREEKMDEHTPVTTAVQGLASRIKIRMPPPDPNMPPGSVEQFYMDYKDGTPQRTQKIANRLADVFVEQSSRQRTERAEETSAFIEQQVMASHQRLNELEGRLRSAKEAYMGALPEQTQSNVTMATGLQQQLQTTVSALRGEQDRLSVIDRQIDAMKTGAGNEITVTGVPGATISAPAARVIALENELAAARAIYTEKHPEIVRLRDELQSAKKDAAADANKPADDRLASLRVDPGYRALLGDREQARLRINELQRQQANIQEQIGMYRSRVESAPRVEQQVATLQRDFDLEKQQYATLINKLRDAELEQGVEKKQGSERFTVLARAALPKEPSSPNIPRLLLITLLAGVCLGGAFGLGSEYLDRAIHDARALTDLELPVLAEIPRIAHI
jgi:polysaccharide chain length determinant protein (PEP-CTERM system associated)